MYRSASFVASDWAFWLSLLFVSNCVTVHESAGLRTHAERDGGWNSLDGSVAFSWQGSYIWPIGACACLWCRDVLKYIVS